MSETMHRAFGAAAIAAPLLLLASTIAFMTAGDGINDGVLGGTLSVWAVIAFGIALVGVLRLLEPHAPRAAALLTLTAIAGVAGGAAFSVGGVYAPIYDLGPDAPLDAVEGADAIAAFAFLPWGWLIPFTLTLTGILFWRTAAIPRTQAVLLIAGGVLFVAGRPARIEPVAVVTDLVLVAALVPIGWAMLQSTRPEPAPA
ncbi:MAG TPA: hypothetical protein VFZ00_34090 [Solirubrobacter sp.]|nr:hypothetical protein [Solirubrobacter sp.]